jgi:ribonuclease HIII
MDTIVTMYTSGKVMFQGLSADIDANMWTELKENTTNKEQEQDKEKYMYCSSIGSDEVGTGDYFGPIVVTASYVNIKDIDYLKSIKVADSKKLTDDQIRKIAPEIIKKIKYKSLILTNKEYNEKHSKDINMNKIKAIMHNNVLYSLKNEIKDELDYIIIDEFTKEKKYYEYISEIPNKLTNITFMTKAEDKNLAVASSSIISRYIFLEEFDKICDKYHLPLAKGAGPQVDKIGQELVEKYGKDVLKDVAKLNFSNTSRVLRTKII